jgi:hypothetical protein
MENRQLEEILNRHVFNEAKPTLLKSIAENPDRFVGAFRSTTPQLKLLQNLLQSREIRFGDAMEEVISALLQEMEFVILPKNFVAEEEMSCDHYFCDDEQTRFYLIEQKMRDDHDSSKKRGQFENFRNKITYLKGIHGDHLIGIMYFIDPSLEKNRNYYRGNIENLTASLGIVVRLFYNGELFEYFGHPALWEQLVSSLKSWRERLGGELELNFDKDPESSIEDLVSVSLGTWRKIIGNDLLWSEGVISTLFPNGRTLGLQKDAFERFSNDANLKSIYRSKFHQLAELLDAHLKQYYPH